MTPVPIRPLSKPERVAAPRQIRPRRGARWVKRMFYRYQPAATSPCSPPSSSYPLVLDLFVSPVRDWIDGQANHHEVGVNLLEHVLVARWSRPPPSTGCSAASASGPCASIAPSRLRRRGAGRGVAAQARTPRAMSGLLADGIERSREPALAIVQGRTGAGRTSFVVGLVNELADRSLIPIPVLRKPRTGHAGVRAAARDSSAITPATALSSDREADEIWHRARSTRDVVILVDGLDDELVGRVARQPRQLQTRSAQPAEAPCFSIVLAATAELPLECSPLREDLDLFSREEAERYVEDQLGHGPGVKRGRRRARPGARPGGRLPYRAGCYLDLLVRLQAGRPLPPAASRPPRSVARGRHRRRTSSGDYRRPDLPPANAGDADSLGVPRPRGQEGRPGGGSQARPDRDRPRRLAQAREDR